MLNCWDLDSFDLTGAESLLRSIHHLLRHHGEFYDKTCKSFLSWISCNHQAVLPKDDGIVMKDLWPAIMYAVGIKQAKSMAMIVMQSRRRDWFTSFLNEFNLDINDEYPYPFSNRSKPLLIRSLNCTDDRLLRFLVKKYNADVNVKDKHDDQTALISTCAYYGFRSITVKYLLRHGADVNAVDKQGLKALDYAVMSASGKNIARYYTV